jgi:hypothetical protein
MAVGDGIPRVHGSFWVANFEKSAAPLTQPLRVTWSWNASGDWDAAGSPRFRFARDPVLYKLYLIQDLSRLDDPDAKESCKHFMASFLPEVQKRIFAQT